MRGGRGSVERTADAAARPERLSGRAALLAVFAVWLASFVLWNQPGVLRPDGAGCLVYLPSAWLDHDLLFFNEWQELRMVPHGVILHKEITRTDHLANHWTVGSALLWFPSFVLGDALQRFTAFPRNGISVPYNLAVLFTSAVAGLFVLVIGMRVVRPLVSPAAAGIAAIGTWLGTPLLWYSLIHATTAHALSALMCAVPFLVRRDRAPAAAESFCIGAAAGLAFAVRPQNAPFIAVAPLLNRRSLSAAYIAGVVFGALPQFVVSSFLYGSPLGFLSNSGPTSAGLHDAFARVYLWETLFSWYHGVATWTPVALLGLIGVFLLFTIDRRLAAACLFVFVCEWLMNGLLDRAFWSGVSFGQRRFDNMAVVFLIGAAVLIHRGRWIGIALAAAACAWTMSLFFAARRGLDLSSYLTPSELLGAPRDLASQFAPFGTAPPQLRGLVIALFAVFAAAALIALLVARAIPLAAAAWLIAAYLAAASLFLGWCGTHDAAHVQTYRALIDANRRFGDHPAGVDFRVALLRDELQFLRKTGRDAEATEVEAEIRRRLGGR